MNDITIGRNDSYPGSSVEKDSKKMLERVGPYHFLMHHFRPLPFNC
jgi:hypothetical protein